MLVFAEAKSDEDFERIKELAEEIMLEHYSSYIPVDHIHFYLREFQSLEAIKNQAATDFDYFILSTDKDIIGYLGLQKSHPKLTISKFYILAKFRGNGYGKITTNFIDDYAKKLDFETIELYVNVKNPVAISLYENTGYSIAERVIRTYDNGHSEEDFIMSKDLKI